MNRKILLGFLLLTAGMAWACSQTGATAKSDPAQVQSAIADKDFTIHVDRAIPMSGRSMHLTSPYSLKIKGDSVYSYLPYFGQAYNVPYGGGNGLIFSEVLTSYKISQGKKDRTVVTFKVRTDEDNHTFYLNIWPNGQSDLSVASINRQMISFEGRMAPGK